MNIFILDENPTKAAKYQCDKHVVKMILESAQLLSTAHRVLDGVESTIIVNNRRKKIWSLNDERESNLYAATHVNHPCNLWSRESCSNYFWLFDHFESLMWVYAYRYGKYHACTKLVDYLQHPPNNIEDKKLTPFAICMNEEDYPNCKVKNDPILSYRNYYKQKYNKMQMHWTADKIPEWFKNE